MTPAHALARATADAHLTVLAPRLSEWGWSSTWVGDVQLRVDALGVRADARKDPYALDLEFSDCPAPRFSVHLL